MLMVLFGGVAYSDRTSAVDRGGVTLGEHFNSPSSKFQLTSLSYCLPTTTITILQSNNINTS